MIINCIKILSNSTKSLENRREMSNFKCFCFESRIILIKWIEKILYEKYFIPYKYFQQKLKNYWQLGVVIHTCDANTWKTQVHGLLGLHGKTLSQICKEINK
jgi:hypothetical protein